MGETRFMPGQSCTGATLAVFWAGLQKHSTGNTVLLSQIWDWLGLAILKFFNVRGFFKETFRSALQH